MATGQDAGLNAAAAASSSDSIPLSQAQDIALRISTVFEGGKPLNYQALADDFDGMGTSFGLIQWNFGQGTLGPVLKKMMVADGPGFAACFGTGCNGDTLKAAILAGSTANQLSWARAILQANRPGWKASFLAVGANPKFQQIQYQTAVDDYHAKSMKVIAHLRDLNATMWKNVMAKSYLAIFDLCVQEGGLDKGNCMQAIQTQVAAQQPATQDDMLKIAATERARLGVAKYMADAMSRRFGILAGSAVSVTQNGVTSKRDNSQFSLIGALGTKFVSGI